ncbi:hypothetical protein JAAARDRAFT_95250, partial [Jaapia argillacea MUCL 33604]
MSDLLPPSPLSMTPNNRPVTPGSSQLSNSVSMGEMVHDSSPSVSGTARGRSRSISPPSDPGLSALNSKSSLSSLSQTQSSDLPPLMTGNWFDSATYGPPIRPLDMEALMVSHEATHAELARTVDELAQWLSVVETGLGHMLDKASEDIIEEE